MPSDAHLAGSELPEIDDRLVVPETRYEMYDGELVILAARGIALDAATRDRIAGERDPQQLDRWIARAAIATIIADVLAGA